MKTKKCYYFFSFRSPYSWISWKKLSSLIKYDIKLIPYWDPDERTLCELEKRGGKFLYNQMSEEKHFYILQDIKRIALKNDLILNFPSEKKPYWELPHILFFSAQERQFEKKYIDEIYKMRWENGGAICEKDFISELFSKHGFSIDVDQELCKYYTKAIDSLYLAFKQGVFGVPFFIYGYNKYWGIDRIIDFVNCINADREDIETTELSNIKSDFFDDHSGGCG